MKAGSPQRQLWDECLNDTVAANAVKAGFRFAVTAIAAGIFRLTKSIGLRRRLPAATAIAAKGSAIRRMPLVVDWSFVVGWSPGQLTDWDL